MNYKIGIDLSYVLNNSETGIKKHGEEIVQGILNLKSEDEIVLFVDKDLKEYYKEKFPTCKIVALKFLLKNVRYVRRINFFGLIKEPKIKKIDKEKCNIVLYPYTDRTTPLVKNANTIVSILDVIPLDAIEDKNSNQYETEKNRQISYMNVSKHILTISNYSKNRLLEINPDYNGEIHVIPCPVDRLEKSEKNVSEIIKTDLPYIFSINSFSRHKNQITLVKAFNLIKEQISHKLVLVGRPELRLNKRNSYNEVIDYIEKNNLNDRVIILSYISDEDRNALFYNADLFISNSLMEGFGRTPVEAALCEIPVISTRETSLPEATMNEVFYYNNPTDENELAQKMLEVIKNKPTKGRLKEIADKLAQEYDEEKIAKQYMELINNIMKGEKDAEN